MKIRITEKIKRKLICHDKSFVLSVIYCIICSKSIYWMNEIFYTQAQFLDSLEFLARLKFDQLIQTYLLNFANK